VSKDAFICPACDYIMDASFLGDDIRDDEQVKRPGRGGHKLAHDFGDALILGHGGGGGFSHFEASDPGIRQREVTHSHIYVGGASQALMSPDAIPARVEGVDPSTLRLTPFERHLLPFIDGKSPVDRVRRRSGMDELDVKATLALLADKGVVRVAGRAFADAPKRPGKSPTSRKVRDETSTLTRDAVPVPKGPPARKPLPPREVRVHEEVTVPVTSLKELDALLESEKGESAERTLLLSADVVAAEAQLAEPASKRRPASPMPIPAGGPAKPTARLSPALAGAGRGAKPAQGLPEVSPEPEVVSDGSLEPLLDEEDLVPPPVEGEVFGGPPEEGGLADRVPSFMGDEPLLPPGVADEDQDEEEPPPEEEEEPPPEGEEEPPPEEEEPPPEEEEPPRPRVVAPLTPIEMSVSQIGLVPIVDAPVVPLPPEPPPPPAPSPRSPAARLEPVRPRGGRDKDGSAVHAVIAEPVAKPVPAVPPPAAPPLPPAPAVSGKPGFRVTPPLRSPEPEAPVAEPSGPRRPAVSHAMRMKADKIFEQALKDLASGNLSSARMNAKLAVIYNPGERRFAEALKEWESAVQVHAKSTNKPPEVALFDQAQAAEARGDFKEAVRLLEQALSANPEVAAIHNRLGVILATRLKEFDRASVALQRAIELDPNNPSIKNNLGKVLGMQQDKLEKNPRRGIFGGKDEGDIVVKHRTYRPKLF
jgi:hypothetical protein